MTLSRRGFLRGASGALGFFGAAAAMNKVFGSEAFAASLDGYAGYRALVAVFLLGGNDGNQMLVPLDSNGSTGQYDYYMQARPNVGLKVADGELLTVNPTGYAAGAFGVHYKMPNLQGLFEAGRAAFVCNVGPLVVPLRKADYVGGLVQRPENLFSHLDQQDAWASAIANPFSIALPTELQGKGPTGWGGRMADKIAEAGLNVGAYPEVITFGGKALLGAGAVRAPLSVGATGELALVPGSDPAFNDARDDGLAEILAITNEVRLEEAYGTVFSAALAYSEQRTAARDAAWAALPSATRTAIDTAFGGVTSDGSLMGQLYQTVRDIVAGATATTSGGLGLRRQMFSVGLGGFDNHSQQRPTHDLLLEQLDKAIGAFQTAMDLLAAAGVFGTTPPQATLFTMSDFGRTLVQDADDGTDHAWGNHMIVVGARVAGKKLYGAYPDLDMSSGGANNDDTTDDRGRWIPTMSVEQISNTFAYWMGVTAAAERAYMFPNLAGYVAAAAAGGFPNAMQSYRLTNLMLADA